MNNDDFKSYLSRIGLGEELSSTSASVVVRVLRSQVASCLHGRVPLSRLRLLSEHIAGSIGDIQPAGNDVGILIEVTCILGNVGRRVKAN
jgi:hypothetical protein